VQVSTKRNLGYNPNSNPNPNPLQAKFKILVGFCQVSTVFGTVHGVRLDSWYHSDIY